MAKAAAKKETELATTQNTELAVSSGYGDYANQGFDNVASTDLQIPFLTILQALSPQVKPIAKGGLGGTIGQLHNTVTDELFDGEAGVGFVPAISQHQFVEWLPDRGGFVAVHEPSSEVVKKAVDGGKFGQLHVGENDLTETYYLFGTLYDLQTENSLGPICIPFKSMFIKAYRRLITTLSMFTVTLEGGRKVNPPMFAHRLKVTSYDDKNAKGEFSNIRLASAFSGGLKDGLLPTDHEFFLAGVNLRDMILKGSAKAAYESGKDGGAEASEAGDGHF